MLKRLLVLTALCVPGAMPAFASSKVPPIEPEASIILVAGGCGPSFHPNRFGECVPNGFYAPRYGRLPPPCPRGYHRDPDPLRRLCYPNL